MAAAAAASRSHFRASHADREQVLEALKAAFVQDRLTKDEFEARVGLALASQTRAELAALVADVPPGLMAGLPPRTPARARKHVSMNSAVTGCGFLVIAANVAMLGALQSGKAAAVILVAILTVIGAAVAIRALILAR
jgi:hypothetical protein